MKAELQKKIFEKYPKIFRDKGESPMKSLMCFGLDIGDGWYELIDEMCSKLVAIEKVSGLVVIARQCKEKYGSLRFYNSICFPQPFIGTIFFSKIIVKTRGYKAKAKQAAIWTNIAEDVIHCAENRSCYTCEDCGEYGKTRRSTGWHSTLCDKHAKERDYTD